jgi:hypothetical protein
MTQQDHVQKVIGELAEQKLRRLLTKYKERYESHLFRETGAGLHFDEWLAIINKLTVDGFCERVQAGIHKGRPCGAFKLILNQQTEVGHGTTNPNA